MDTELRVASALQLLERVAREMCQGGVEMSAEITDSLVCVRFVTATPTDSRILNGREGKHIKSLTTLAILMFNSAHARVRVEGASCSLGSGEAVRVAFEPRKDWPQLRIVSLVLDLAAACLDRPTVVCRPVEGNSEKSLVQIRVPSVGVREVRFYKAVAVLLGPIGAKCGRRLGAAIYSEKK